MNSHLVSLNTGQYLTNKNTVTQKAPNFREIMKNDDCVPLWIKELSGLFDDGWRIKRTSCACGGNWAWLRETEKGSMKMYGCICHHVPDKDFK